ncbi:MAG: peptidylprolyl isomerase [Oscillospiraceae bacterium]|nr:peptidylprolyl isomerase [Oscillospiraceae bacterium]
MTNPVVTIEMETGGVIKAELYPDVAPQSVRNFIYLIQKGFYDGKIFHRVIPGFMIQGGCPDGTGMGGPGYHIKGEFLFNSFENKLKHKRGVLSMARSQAPNSAGSQFFIMHADAPHLDGQYAAFGKVLSGMDIVDEIANAPKDFSDRPKTMQVMKQVTVDTFGETYEEPKKL